MSVFDSTTQADTIEILAVRGIRGVAVLRTQYGQASAESSSTSYSLKHGRKRVSRSGLLCMRPGCGGSQLGEILQEPWEEMVGLADRRGKFPDYLSFTVKLKQTRFK